MHGTVDLGDEAGASASSLGLRSVERHRRRRRPTGAPRPCRGASAPPARPGSSPRRLLAWIPAALTFDPVLRVADRADPGSSSQVARLRTSWLTDVMRASTGWRRVDAIAGVAVGRGDRAVSAGGGTCSPSWSHRGARVVGGSCTTLSTRPRPYGVTIIGRWSGFSMPSPPVAVLSASWWRIALHPRRPRPAPRPVARSSVAALIALFAVARLYLGVDHPSDVILAVTLGVAHPAHRVPLFTPNEVFPVAYRTGKTAHLDVGGARGEAIRRGRPRPARADGARLKPVGLAARADRRRSAAGRGRPRPVPVRQALRDEPRPGRPLVQARPDRSSTAASRTRRRSSPSAGSSSTRTTPLRLLQDAGIPTAGPYGIVEMTPEREYLLVTEFFDGAKEIGDAEVDDEPHRPGTAAGPPALGRRPGPPRHQAGQPAGPATASCCSSTWPSCRSDRRRGARPSTWPT